MIRQNLLDSLVVHLRGLDVGRDGVGKVTQLADISSSVDVDALREVVVRRFGRGEVGRETAVHGRVDELRALREEQLAHVMDRETSLLHCVSDGHGLEVATVMHAP